MRQLLKAFILVFLARFGQALGNGGGNGNGNGNSADRGGGEEVPACVDLDPICTMITLPTLDAQYFLDSTNIGTTFINQPLDCDCGCLASAVELYVFPAANGDITSYDGNFVDTIKTDAFPISAQHLWDGEPFEPATLFFVHRNPTNNKMAYVARTQAIYNEPYANQQFYDEDGELSDRNIRASYDFCEWVEKTSWQVTDQPAPIYHEYVTADQTIQLNHFVSDFECGVLDAICDGLFFATGYNLKLWYNGNWVEFDDSWHKDYQIMFDPTALTLTLGTPSGTQFKPLGPQEFQLRLGTSNYVVSFFVTFQDAPCILEWDPDTDIDGPITDDDHNINAPDGTYSLDYKIIYTSQDPVTMESNYIASTGCFSQTITFDYSYSTGAASGHFNQRSKPNDEEFKIDTGSILANDEVTVTVTVTEADQMITHTALVVVVYCEHDIPPANWNPQSPNWMYFANSGTNNQNGPHQSPPMQFIDLTTFADPRCLVDPGPTFGIRKHHDDNWDNIDGENWIISSSHDVMIDVTDPNDGDSYDGEYEITHHHHNDWDYRTNELGTFTVCYLTEPDAIDTPQVLPAQLSSTTFELKSSKLTNKSICGNKIYEYTLTTFTYDPTAGVQRDLSGDTLTFSDFENYPDFVSNNTPELQFIGVISVYSDADSTRARWEQTYDLTVVDCDQKILTVTPPGPEFPVIQFPVDEYVLDFGQHTFTYDHPACIVDHIKITYTHTAVGTQTYIWEKVDGDWEEQSAPGSPVWESDPSQFTFSTDVFQFDNPAQSVYDDDHYLQIEFGIGGNFYDPVTKDVTLDITVDCTQIVFTDPHLIMSCYGGEFIEDCADIDVSLFRSTNFVIDVNTTLVTGQELICGTVIYELETRDDQGNILPTYATYDTGTETFQVDFSAWSDADLSRTVTHHMLVHHANYPASKLEAYSFTSQEADCSVRYRQNSQVYPTQVIFLNLEDVNPIYIDLNPSTPPICPQSNDWSKFRILRDGGMLYTEVASRGFPWAREADYSTLLIDTSGAVSKPAIQGRYHVRSDRIYRETWSDAVAMTHQVVDMSFEMVLCWTEVPEETVQYVKFEPSGSNEVIKTADDGYFIDLEKSEDTEFIVKLNVYNVTDDPDCGEIIFEVNSLTHSEEIFLDLIEDGRLEIDQQSGKLHFLDIKSYPNGQITVTYQVRSTNSDVPFYIGTVVLEMYRSYDFYYVVNTPPEMLDLAQVYNLLSGIDINITAGIPYDKQDDSLYIAEWGFKNIPEIDWPTWFTFKNVSIENGIQFESKSPPPSDVERFYDVYFVVSELNKENPYTREFTFRIIVTPFGLVPVIEVVPYRYVNLTISDLYSDNVYDNIFNITFSDKILVPAHCTLWTDWNEGGEEKMLIELDASQETSDVIYDQDLEIEVRWQAYEVYLEGVQIVYEPEDARRQMSGRQLDQERQRHLQGSSRFAQGAYYEFKGEVETNQGRQSIEIDFMRVRLDLSERQKLSKEAYDRLFVDIKQGFFSLEEDFDFERFKRDEERRGFQAKLRVERSYDSDVRDVTERIIEVTENFMIVFLGANATLSLFFSGLLQFLWGLINTLQIIVVTVLFNIETPDNAESVMIMILKLCNLDFKSTDFMIEKWFKFRETEYFAEQITSDGQVISKYEQAGFESVIYIDLLGPVFFALLLTVIYVMLKLFLRKIALKCKDNWFKTLLRLPFSVRVFYLRILLEGCIEFSLSAMITILMLGSESFKNPWEVFSTFVAFLTLSTLIIVTILLVRAAYRYGIEVNKRRKMQQLNPNRRKQIENQEIFQEQRFDGWAALYPSFFIVRRISVILMITIAPSFKYMQIVGQCTSTLILAAFIAAVRPFMLPFQNKQEFLNEITVLLAAYPLLTFTGWIDSIDLIYGNGWFIISCIIISIIGNFLVWLYFAYKVAVLGCKHLYARHIIKKRQKEALRKRPYTEKIISETQNNLLTINGNIILTQGGCISEMDQSLEKGDNELLRKIELIGTQCTGADTDINHLDLIKPGEDKVKNNDHMVEAKFKKSGIEGNSSGAPLNDMSRIIEIQEQSLEQKNSESDDQKKVLEKEGTSANETKKILEISNNSCIGIAEDKEAKGVQKVPTDAAETGNTNDAGANQVSIDKISVSGIKNDKETEPEQIDWMAVNVETFNKRVDDLMRRGSFDEIHDLMDTMERHERQDVLKQPTDSENETVKRPISKKPTINVIDDYDDPVGPVKFKRMKSRIGSQVVNNNLHGQPEITKESEVEELVKSEKQIINNESIKVMAVDREANSSNDTQKNVLRKEELATQEQKKEPSLESLTVKASAEAQIIDVTFQKSNQSSGQDKKYSSDVDTDSLSERLNSFKSLLTQVAKMPLSLENIESKNTIKEELKEVQDGIHKFRRSTKPITNTREDNKLFSTNSGGHTNTSPVQFNVDVD